jgi:hypothetical protein
MKTMHIYICSGFCKHGWIPSMFSMGLSTGYGIIENENRVTGKYKNPSKINKYFRTYFVFYMFQDP